jgi:hypothetical protein
MIPEFRPSHIRRCWRARRYAGSSAALSCANLIVETGHLPSWPRIADRYRMRRAFLRAFGQPPQVIRRNARAEVAA